MDSVRIPLGSRKYPGLFALIDEEDYERVSQHHWSTCRPHAVCYAVTNIDGKTVSLHRFLLRVGTGVQIDHINHDGLDNRRVNLRPCTYRENAGNQRLSRRNTSGYRGVSWRKHEGCWQAVIKVDMRLRHLGLFVEIEDAARAYDAAARKHFGEFAQLNFP